MVTRGERSLAREATRGITLMVGLGIMVVVAAAVIATLLTLVMN